MEFGQAAYDQQAQQDAEKAKQEAEEAEKAKKQKQDQQEKEIAKTQEDSCSNECKKGLIGMRTPKKCEQCKEERRYEKELRERMMSMCEDYGAPDNLCKDNIFRYFGMIRLNNNRKIVFKYAVDFLNNIKKINQSTDEGYEQLKQLMLETTNKLLKEYINNDYRNNAEGAKTLLKGWNFLIKYDKREYDNKEINDEIDNLMTQEVNNIIDMRVAFGNKMYASSWETSNYKRLFLS